MKISKKLYLVERLLIVVFRVLLPFLTYFKVKYDDYGLIQLLTEQLTHWNR